MKSYLFDMFHIVKKRLPASRTARLRASLAAAAALLLGGAALTGCTAEVDGSMGWELLPSDQKMEMRHLTFKGGKVIRFDAAHSTDDESLYEEVDPGRALFETRLLRSDSISSVNLSRGYIGVERNDTFGVRTAALASSIMYMNAVPDSVKGFGYKPIFDTMKLVLSIDAYGTDTLSPVRYTIYELQKPLLGNAINADDTTAYICCDMLAAGKEMYDPSRPLFTFTFPDGETTGPKTSYVPLTPVDMSETGATWDFVRRLMLIPKERTGWDGYANDNIEIYNDKTMEKWVDNFHGIYIVPDTESAPEGSCGSLYATDMEVSGLLLQGRNRNPEDPSLIKDTVGMTLLFIDYTQSDFGNMSVNTVAHDYGRSTTSAPSLLAGVSMDDCDAAGNKVPREERTLVDMCYVEGMGGPVTELYFTDAFLDELMRIYEDEQNGGEEYALAGINQCMIYLYLQDAYYDWERTQGNAAVITPLLNSSLTRLGMYYSLPKVKTIPDYNYVYENQSSTTLDYNGYLNRSRACYPMNITSYMQALCTYVRSLEKLQQEDGQTRVSADGSGNRVYTFVETDEGYVPRAIQIGPEAQSQYLLKRARFQGMNGEAPVQVELTYTMIKGKK